MKNALLALTAIAALLTAAPASADTFFFGVGPNGFKFGYSQDRPRYGHYDEYEYRDSRRDSRSRRDSYDDDPRLSTACNMEMRRNDAVSRMSGKELGANRFKLRKSRLVQRQLKRAGDPGCGRRW